MHVYRPIMDNWELHCTQINIKITPDKLPITDLNYQMLFSLVGDASSELARYDGLLQGIPNPDVMLSPLTTREAVLSSKIEGTQATVDETA